MAICGSIVAAVVVVVVVVAVVMRRTVVGGRAWDVGVGGDRGAVKIGLAVGRAARRRSVSFAWGFSLVVSWVAGVPSVIEMRLDDERGGGMSVVLRSIGSGRLCEVVLALAEMPQTRVFIFLGGEKALHVSVHFGTEAGATDVFLVGSAQRTGTAGALVQRHHGIERERERDSV